MILEMVCPGVILKGEVVMEPKELPVYFGTEQDPECHMLYGVSSMVNLWAALATRDTRMLKHQMDVIHSLPRTAILSITFAVMMISAGAWMKSRRRSWR